VRFIPIYKHSVFIVSTGRTGTKFIGKVLPSMIDDCYSTHEPAGVFVTDRSKWKNDIKKYGFLRMTVGQLTPKYSMYKLSSDRRAGRVSDDKALRYIEQMRKSVLKDVIPGLYVESNNHLHGVVDLLEKVFPNSRVVFVIRDPRTWIRSVMSTKASLLYSKIDLPFLNISMKATDFKDDLYAQKWKDMSKFEKLSWYYNKLNSFVLEKMSGKSNFKVYRYEDLLINQDREKYFKEFLDFITNFEDGFSKNYEFKPQLLNRKVNSSSKNYVIPHWKEWKNKEAVIMEKHCGQLMKKFNYGQESEWNEKVEKGYTSEIA